MRKVKLAERASVKHLAALESEMFRDVMAVLEFLAMLQYDDGTPRQGGFLMMWCEGSAWKVVVKDKDSDAQMPVVGKTADEAFGTLALMLGAEDAPWEPAKASGRSGARKGR